MSVTDDFLPDATELNFVNDVRDAQNMIDEALRHAGVDSDTDPETRDTVEQGVKYAVYASLGLTGIIGSLSPEYIEIVDATTQQAISEIQAIRDIRFGFGDEATSDTTVQYQAGVDGPHANDIDDLLP